MDDIDISEILNSNVGIDGVTRTNKTLMAYLTRGHQMWQRAANDLLVNAFDLRSCEYLAWLEHNLPALKPPSRRQYIASTRCMLDVMYQQAADDNVKHELMTSLQYANSMKSEQYNPAATLEKKWRGATSSQKSKKFSDEELDLFVSEVKKLKWTWAECAAVWIAANRMVGLRPIEWRNTTIIEGQSIVLELQNAKHTNGRANGRIRHIDITNLRKEELALIKIQLKYVARYAISDAQWQTYYSGVRQAIYRIVRRTLGNLRKFPSLYSTRHQFSADAKSSGMSKPEIAALMGHATDETATMHYGKKRHGKGVCRVKPNADEVATVRIKIDKSLHNNKCKTYARLMPIANRT